MTVEPLSSNVVNYLVWRYLQEAGRPCTRFSSTPLSVVNVMQAMGTPRYNYRDAGTVILIRSPLQRTSRSTPSSTSCRMAFGSTRRRQMHQMYVQSASRLDPHD